MLPTPLLYLSVPLTFAPKVGFLNSDFCLPWNLSQLQRSLPFQASWSPNQTGFLIPLEALNSGLCTFSHIPSPIRTFHLTIPTQRLQNKAIPLAQLCVPTTQFREYFLRPGSISTALFTFNRLFGNLWKLTTVFLDTFINSLRIVQCILNTSTPLPQLLQIHPSPYSHNCKSSTFSLQNHGVRFVLPSRSWVVTCSGMWLTYQGSCY